MKRLVWSWLLLSILSMHSLFFSYYQIRCDCLINCRLRRTVHCTFSIKTKKKESTEVQKTNLRCCSHLNEPDINRRLYFQFDTTLDRFLSFIFLSIQGQNQKADPDLLINLLYTAGLCITFLYKGVNWF